MVYPLLREQMQSLVRQNGVRMVADALALVCQEAAEKQQGLLYDCGEERDDYRFMSANECHQASIRLSGDLFS